MKRRILEQDDNMFFGSVIYFSRIYNPSMEYIYLIDTFFKKIDREYHMNTKHKEINFNPDGSMDIKGLRNIVESTRHEVILDCKDNKGNLVENIYLPRSSKENPYIRHYNLNIRNKNDYSKNR